MGSHWCGMKFGVICHCFRWQSMWLLFTTNESLRIATKTWGYLGCLFISLLFNSPIYCRYTGLGIRVNQNLLFRIIPFKTCEVMKGIFYFLYVKKAQIPICVYGWMWHNTNAHNKRILSSRFWMWTEIYRYKRCPINPPVVTLPSGASGSNAVWVQVPSPAPYRTKENHLDGSPLFVFYPGKAVFGCEFVGILSR